MRERFRWLLAEAEQFALKDFVSEFKAFILDELKQVKELTSATLKYFDFVNLRFTIKNKEGTITIPSGQTHPNRYKET